MATITPLNSKPSDLSRRERKRLQQLDHLANTAWNLFESEDFEAVTMERIAEVADVSKVTLYRHFPVKEALLRHIFHRELAAAWGAIHEELAAVAPGKARLTRFLTLQAAWCESRRIYLLPYTRFRLSETHAPGGSRERSGLDKIFTELITQGQQAGEFRTDQPAALLAMHLQFAHLATILRCLAQPELPLSEAFIIMLDLVCSGMENAK